MTVLDNRWLDDFHRLGAADGHEFGLPPAAKLAQLVRPAIVARPGKVLVWSDWSGLEARGMPWLAATREAEEKLNIYRATDADPSLPGVYEVTAGGLLGKDPLDVTDEERQSHGKVPELSLQFGGGLGALLNMASNYRVYLDNTTALEMIAKWRDNNRWAKNFWGKHAGQESYGLWGAVNSALEQPNVIQPVGRVAYVYKPDYLGGSLMCALPCERVLTYPGIRWEQRWIEDKRTGELELKTQLTYRKGYGRAAMWYGKCAENITQAATTGSLLRQTLVALEAEEDWMPVVGHTHDEIVTEVDEKDADDAAAVLTEYMLDGFDWTEGLPLACETTINWYYTKAKVEK